MSKSGKKSDQENDNTGSPQMPQPEGSQHAGFPVVGLGASAGGLEALKGFFANVPEHSGRAYIVNVHMPPKQPGIMP
jgi:two-component system CheB/CheR fusion protein